MPILHVVEWCGYPTYTDEGEYVRIDWTAYAAGVAIPGGRWTTYGVHEDYAEIYFAELHEHLEELHEDLLDLPWHAHGWLTKKGEL